MALPLYRALRTRYPWLRIRENILGTDHVIFRNSGTRKKDIDVKSRKSGV